MTNNDLNTEELRNEIYVFSLNNAVKHKSVPKPGAILGILMNVHPNLKSCVSQVNTILLDVIKAVQSMSVEDRELELQNCKNNEIYKSAFQVLDNIANNNHKDHHSDLPELPGSSHGVVMRFAPNPSGPLHLGHARASYLNDYYVRKYGGKLYYRVEDTDPKRIDTDAYTAIPKDLEWLGINITDTVIQSDRFDIYYEKARELMSLGGAYMCTCNNDTFKELKLKKKPCPCRNQSIQENLKLLEDMLNGKYKEGSITMRVKTDITHPDPAIRDFAAMRVLTSIKHPRRPDIFVYPLMNFSVVIDDHELGVTHVIRGKDHIANTRRQEYIYNYFGWKMPYFYHYGRMSISDLELSTSGMRKGIEEGKYTGWDDIHLGTLQALKRRGIQPQAVKNAILELGIGNTDISFSWENLFAKNKAIIDNSADRYFFVPDPIEVEIKNDLIPFDAHAPIYPNCPERGERILTFKDKVYLPRSELNTGNMLRLKDLFNIKITSNNTANYLNNSIEEAKAQKSKIIQWLPIDRAIKCKLSTPNGELTGYCEDTILKYNHKIVQFERIGFAKIDDVTPDGTVIAYFTHR
ncbi:MAG TPA: glutamate--tRNA ligase [Methanocorpusculum sp.]|nr:glutamate--tRNA ligase [Methanocorpusculum sp.]